MKKNAILLSGMKDGIPIALGYLSVSFGFGITAAGLGISVLHAFIISLTNLTSAGQAQGVSIIAANGSLMEMALVQFIINIRYALMAISLSQNLDKSFTLRHRLIASYGITDEIFAVCATRKEPITPTYMYGIIAVSAAGWTLGTLLGASAGEILPVNLTAALGIMLYGMFIAIILPPAKKSLGVLLVIILSAAFSTVCKYLLPFISGGFAVIICGITAALIGALLFPVKEEKEP